ncbi:ATP-dependent helicase [Prevotella sp. OH937_COT-195]|uniref:ATP-dependent helicase n=1 Tax=Prevotella sp. OH937_COT-195 TaxID=2491051 RepID=UPI000F646B87|nr:UvrD-helicase domain-containing protein [Prevotella sp. OH937_COT-195]RRD02424.1 ATP-dependent DNA helicase [Prevotella sp. OH937_COT-195]
MDTESILSQLNDSQREAVMSTEGPSLVIAGAGSGKTRVLTYKIAYLLQLGIKPWNILALTFTNKAAREMKQRIGSLVGSEVAGKLVMGTFHSIFSRILRVEAERIGYTSNFTIYDEADSRSLLKNIIREMGFDDKIYKPASVHGRISMAKNRLINASDYANDYNAIENDRRQRVPNIYKVYLAYADRCRQANAMDFDDLLLMTHTLLRDNEDIRRKYAERFMYVLVDEYQDTNTVQQKIVFQLTSERKNVCVVGDDAQSIYSFRGANIDNILNFREMYNGAKLFKLERNYRSTQHIVEAANSLIRHNERQIPKEIYSKNGNGNKLILKPTYSDREEAVVVCNEIKAIRRRENCTWDDFAILYRTNAQSRAFEEALLHNNIPYRVYGGLSFYQRKEIKDVIAYLRLVVNPDDDEALRRIINYPARGIGATTVSKIYSCAYESSVSMWKVISRPLYSRLNVNKGTLAKLNAFRELIMQFIEKKDNVNAYELGRDIIVSSGIQKDLYGETTPEYVSRQENLDELLGGLQDFVESKREEGDEHCMLVDYLQEVSLLSDLDSDDDAETSRVTMMTVHSAKGLEFPTVFVVGLEENIFPSPMSAETKRGLEEERRLLYVAITRAERNCILTFARNRFRYGKMEFDTPSRFLAEINPSLMRIDSESGDSFFLPSSRPSSGRYGGGRYQNSNPVASQFRADPKEREAIHREERGSDPLSPAFRRTLATASGNLRRVNAVSSPRQVVPTANCRSSSISHLQVGATIEHDRFGIGNVINVEGTGENVKATVAFRNVGTKQLLLKFAKFKVVE